MDRLNKIITLGLLVVTTSSMANTGVALKLSTLGVGVEATSNINEKINLRYGINGYTHSETGTKSDIDYDIDLKLKSAGVILDYHPFDNGFRLSGGLYYNGNKIDANAKATATKSINIDGTTYTHSQAVALDVKTDFRSTAPYLSIGYGDALSSSWGFNCEVGALFQGSPTTKLTATSNLTGAAKTILDNHVKNEEKEFNKEMEDFDIYPIVSFGVSYKF